MDNDAHDYKVGYGKPPKHTQFQKGQSGNHKGRPKGSKNKPKDFPVNVLNELIYNECMREITIHEGNKQKNITILEASVKLLSKKALQGDHRSQKLLLESFNKAEKSLLDFNVEKLEIAVQYKSGALREIDNAKSLGQPEPDIIPHPEHIDINPRTGEVKFIGPMDEKEKKEWDLCVARIFAWQDEVKELEQEILDIDTPSHKKYARDRIEFLNEMIGKLRQVVPEDIFIPPSTIEFVKSNPDIYNSK